MPFSASRDKNQPCTLAYCRSVSGALGMSVLSSSFGISFSINIELYLYTSSLLATLQDDRALAARPQWCDQPRRHRPPDHQKCSHRDHQQVVLEAPTFLSAAPIHEESEGAMHGHNRNYHVYAAQRNSDYRIQTTP